MALSGDGSTLLTSNLASPGNNVPYTHASGNWTQLTAMAPSPPGGGGYEYLVALNYDGTSGFIGTGETGGGAFPFATWIMPTVASSAVGFKSLGLNSLTDTLVAGNGGYRAIFMTQGSTGSPTVSNGTTYTANSAFGSGTATGAWYCVYNGTGTGGPVTGLAAHTTYRTVAVEYNGNPNGNPVPLSGEIYATSIGAGNPVNVTTQIPVITVSGTLPAMSSTFGSPSSSPSTFTVSGVYVSAFTPNIQLTAPAGYELSTTSSTSGFASTGAVLGSGTIPATTVYVRLAATAAAGSIPAGNIVVSTLYGASVNEATVISTVAQAPLTITATAVSKSYGVALPATATGSTGFTSTALVNADAIGTVSLAYGAGSAATDPFAVNASSVTPSAALTTSGGTFLATNYSITYVKSTLSVTKVPLTITSSAVAANMMSYGSPLTVQAASTAFTPVTGVNGEVVTSVTNTPSAPALSATTNALSTYTVTPSAALGSGTFNANNYTITYLPYNGTISKGALILTALGRAKGYGTSIATLTTTNTALFSATGLASGESVTGITLTPTGTGIAATAAVNTTYLDAPSAPTGTGTFAASNYTVTANSYAGTVTQGVLTITANDVPKTYGSLITGGSGSTQFTYSGLASTDALTSVTITYGTGAAANSAVAAYPLQVSASAPASTGTFVATNYAITYVKGTITVGQAPLIIAASNVAANLKVYGTALSTVTGSTAFAPVSGLNGETITSVTNTPSASGMAATTPVGTGNYTVTPSAALGGNGFLASNYNINYTIYTGSVTAAPLTLTALGLTKTFGTTLGSVTTSNTAYFTATGMQNSETVTGVTLNPTGTGASATAAYNTAYTETPAAPTGGGGFLASNYSIISATYSGTVGKAPLTITANDYAKTYGASLSGGAGSALFTSGGLLGADVISSVTLAYGTGSAMNAAVAAYALQVTPSVPVATSGTFVATNYAITFVNGMLTVGKAPLIIAASNAAANLKPYGTQLAIVSGSTAFTPVSGLNGETITSVTNTPNATGMAATTPVGTGNYTVTPSAALGGNGFLASNYNITYTIYTGSVTPAPLTLTALGLAKIFGTVLAPVTTSNTAYFTATGMQNSETVTGVTLNPTGTGTSATAAYNTTYIETPSAPTGGGGFLASNYNIIAATYAGTVGQAPLTITANDYAKTYGASLSGAAGSALFTFSGLLGSDVISSVTLAYGTGSATNAAVAAYPLQVTPSVPVATSGTFVASNYAINFVNGMITVGKAPLTIATSNAAANLKPYGTQLAAVTGSTAFTPVSGLNGETITSVTNTPNAPGMAATTPVGTGNYMVTPSAALGGNGFLASNYNITYTIYTGSVTPAPLTLTALGVAKIYGTALVAAATSNTAYFTATGMQNSETVTGVTLNPTGTGTSATAAYNTTYIETPSAPTGGGGFLASNYNIIPVTWSGTVAKAPLTLTATGLAKAYGVVLSAGASTSFSTSAVTVPGETVTSVTLTPDAAGASASTPAGAGYYEYPTAATGTGGFLESNYLVSYLPFHGTVGLTNVTVTATNPGRTYGTGLSAGTSNINFTATGMSPGQTVTSVTLTPDAPGSAASTAAHAGYLMIPSLATGAGGFSSSNYNMVYTNYSGTVSPALLSVTATGPSKIYGTSLPTGTSTTNFLATGMTNGETVTGLTLTPSASGTLATTAANGSYTVVPSLATGPGSFLESNYTVTYNNFTGYVSPLALSLVATGPPKGYGTALTTGPSTTNFSASGMVPGENVTGLTLTPDAAGLSASTPINATYKVTPSAPTGTNGFNASNYAITPGVYTGTVTSKVITITATGPLKKYGTALATTTSTSSFTVTGLNPGETVTSVTLTPDAAGMSATTANGANYLITPSAATGTGGFVAANYTINYVNYTGTVGTSNLTITATSPNKTYGTALVSGTSGAGFTVSGTLPGETVTSVMLTDDAAAQSATTAASVTYKVTPTVATGTGGFLASNYIINYVPYSGPVLAAPLSVLATSPLKSYGTSLSANAVTTGFTASGLVGSDLVTGVTLTPDAAGQSATSAVGATYLARPAAATGNSSFLTSNYIITYLPYTGTVSAIGMTITATGPAKTFGTALTPGATSSNFTATGMVPGEQVTGITLTPDLAGQSATTAKGAPYVMTPSAATGTGGFLASNYIVTYVNFTGSVGALSLVITATGTPKVYGQSLSAATVTTGFSATGMASGDQVTGITLTPDAPGASATTAAGLPFVMTPSLASGNSSFIATNYIITYNNFTGTVAQQPLVISATGPLKKYTMALTAGASTGNFTAVGAISGESVTSVTLTPDAAGLSASTANGAPYSVAASAATGGGSFNVANYAITYPVYYGTVGTAALTVTATGPAKSYGSTLSAGASTTSFTTSGTFAGETVTGVTLTPDAAGASALTGVNSLYKVRPSAATGTGGFLASNYSVTYVDYSGPVTAALMSLTATGPTKSYGQVLAASSSSTNFTQAGLVNGESVSSVTLSPDGAGTSASTASGATYAITPSAPLGSGSFNPSNYIIAYNPFHGTVSSSTVTVTATVINKLYGQVLAATNSASNFTATGMAAGEHVTGVTLTPDAQGASATAAFNAGYVVTPSAATGTGGFLASNYVMVYNNYNGLVGLAPMTVTATGPSKIYGTTMTTATSSDPANFTATGMQNSEQVTGLTLYPDGAAASATTSYGNNYKITPGLATGTAGFAASNYSINYIPFTGTVGLAPMTVTATGPSKTFGTALAVTTGNTSFSFNGQLAGEVVSSVTLTPDGPGLAANTPNKAAYVITPSAATGTNGFNPANYNIHYAPYTGIVGGTTLTITATGPGRIYGTGLSTTTGSTNFTVSGLLSGDQVTGMTLTPDANGAAAGTPQGSAYRVTPSAPTGNGSFLASNYTVVFVPFDGVVSPLALTITATAPVRMYHTALTTGSGTAFTATGLASGDLVNSVTLTPDAAGLSATTPAGAAYIVKPSAPVGNSAFLASNYTITYTPYTGAVTASVLTVSATGPAKTYGSVLAVQNATGGLNYTASGMVGGETVTQVTLTPDNAGTSASTAVGAGYVITPSAVSGGAGFLASNYILSYLPYNGTVTAGLLTITATGPLKKYGTSLATTTSTSSFTVTGLNPGESVTSVVLTPDAAGMSSTTANNANYVVTPSAATGAGGFATANYTISYIPYTGTVGNLTLTLTANSANKIYGTALVSGTSGAGFTVSGTLPGETVTSVMLTDDGAAQSATTAAGLTYKVTPTLATGTGGFLASNYTINYVPYSGPVLAAPLSVLANSPLKVYGTGLTSATVTTGFTASGLVGSDLVTGVTLTPDAAGQSATSAVGATYLVKPTAATGNSSFLTSNYTITYLPYTGTVSAIGMTITATGPGKIFGTALTAGTTGSNFTAMGMANGEQVTGITLSPDAPGQSTSTAALSTYVMTPSLATGTNGFLASNYIVTYVPFTGTVGALALSITATGTSKVYGQALTAIAGGANFTAVGAVNGDQVTRITLTPDAPGASATTSAGQHFVMTPSLPGGNSTFIATNYIITYTNFTGTVSQQPLAITATGPLKKYGVGLTAGASTGNFTAVGAISGESVSGVTLTPDAAGLSASTANGAPYSVAPSAPTGSGTFNVANYAITYGVYYGTVGTAVLTVTATDPAKNYGTALSGGASTTGFTTSGTFAGETVTGMTLTPNAAAASATTPVGSTYSVMPKAATGTGGFLESNYTVTYLPSSSLVLAAPLTITASGPTKAFGQALTAASSTLNFGSSGMVNGDVVSSVLLTPDAAGMSSVTAAGAGYLITPSAPSSTGSFLASNYLITYLPYQGTVASSALTITATGPNKVYGTALTAGPAGTGYTVTGLLAGQQVTSLMLSPDANGMSATAAAGSAYMVTPSGATGTGGFNASNYTIIYLPYTGKTAPRVLNLKAIAASKVYTGTTDAVVSFTDDRLAGDVFTTSSTAASFTDRNAGKAKLVTVSGISLQGGAAANYTVAATATSTATITQAPAVLTAQAVSKNYNKTITSQVLPVITGLLGTDATSPVLAETFDTYNVGAGKTLTPTVVVNDGNGGNNYLVTAVTSSLGEITTAPLTVTAQAATKVYDGTVSSPGIPLVSGFYGTDALGTAPIQAYDSPAAGTGKLLVPTGATVIDGNGGKNYSINYVNSLAGSITAASTVLTNLAISSGSLSPAFSTAVTSYKVLVDNSVASMTVTPTTTGAVSLLTINGLPVVTGTASSAITLKYGVNTLTFKVMAQNGSVASSYTLTVVRGASADANLAGLLPGAGILSPAFSKDVQDYTVTVDYFVSSTIVTPNPEDGTATVLVNGSPLAGNSSVPIVLNVGPNIVTSVVTAQDGVTQKTYTITITRPAAPLTVLANNVLSPNGDGVNDQWVINGIRSFPQSVVTVYDRTGRVVFTQKGYDNTWNATFRGSVLPEDTYYYTIDLGNGSKVTRGFITLLYGRK